MMDWRRIGAKPWFESMLSQRHLGSREIDFFENLVRIQKCSLKIMNLKMPQKNGGNFASASIWQKLVRQRKSLLLYKKRISIQGRSIRAL